MKEGGSHQERQFIETERFNCEWQEETITPIREGANVVDPVDEVVAVEHEPEGLPIFQHFEILTRVRTFNED